MTSSSLTITYACPACGRTNVRRLDSEATNASDEAIGCSACGRQSITTPVPRGAGRIVRCLVCPSTDLFVRKDFPQRLGVWIVVVGFAASCVAWGFREMVWTFGILFMTAAIDVLLYLFMPECLSCYRCGARYRGRDVTRLHGPFNLEVHERQRQSVARSREMMRQPVEERP
ncbi:MAG: hypothetical protein ACKOCN_11310 [Planctomycetaceae bacterium]